VDITLKFARYWGSVTVNREHRTNTKRPEKQDKTPLDRPEAPASLNVDDENTPASFEKANRWVELADVALRK
jgi:hypothetical protein